MKPMEEYFVPWLKGQKMYISSHIELAWKSPALKRMMSNENPLPPSAKVEAAIQKYGRMANRYPDQGLVVRAWQEAAVESMPRGASLWFKRLREDRVLRPL